MMFRLRGSGRRALVEAGDAGDMNARLVRRSSEWITDQLKEDDGMALATVVAFSAILFLLATTLVMLATQQQLTTSHVVARNKALHAADAGITAFLYKLRYHSDDLATMGPTQTTEGSWTVTASRTSSSAPITLRSVGEIPGLNAKRTIVSTVRFPTFADYSVAINGDYSLGSGATINGKVRCNGNMSNSGTIKGGAYATGSVGGSGSYQGGRYPNYAPMSFSAIAQSITALKAQAQGINTYVPPAGGTNVGYRVILNGSTLTYQKIASIDSSPEPVLTGTPTVMTIPSPPSLAVIFFDDRVWVSGTYSLPLTLVAGPDFEDANNGVNTTSSFFIMDNLMPTDTNSTSVCGLVTPGDISFPITYKSFKAKFQPTTSELDVWAALLSQNGEIHADGSTSPLPQKIVICGSRTQDADGGLSSGFINRIYDYDERLDAESPPMYPPLTDGSMKVDSWIEN